MQAHACAPFQGIDDTSLGREQPHPEAISGWTRMILEMLVRRDPKGKTNPPHPLVPLFVLFLDLRGWFQTCVRWDGYIRWSLFM